MRTGAEPMWLRTRCLWPESVPAGLAEFREIEARCERASPGPWPRIQCSMTVSRITNRIEWRANPVGNFIHLQWMYNTAPAFKSPHPPAIGKLHLQGQWGCSQEHQVRFQKGQALYAAGQLRFPPRERSPAAASSTVLPAAPEKNLTEQFGLPQLVR